MNTLCNVIAAGAISCQTLPFTPPVTVSEQRALVLCEIKVDDHAGCLLRWRAAKLTAELRDSCVKLLGLAPQRLPNEQKARARCRAAFGLKSKCEEIQEGLSGALQTAATLPAQMPPELKMQLGQAAAGLIKLKSTCEGD